MARLVFCRNNKLFLSVNLTAPTVLIGRAEYCDVQLPDDRVSRSHVRISVEEGSYWVENLSINGTRLNAAMVEGRQPINTVDRLYIQDYAMILVDDQFPTGPQWIEPTVTG